MAHDAHGQGDPHKDDPKKNKKPKLTGDEIKQLKGIWEKLLGPVARIIDLNTLLSLLNPFLGEWAEKAAETMKSKLAPDHWLFTAKAEAAIGACAGILESAADRHDEPLKAILKKASDWFEGFARAMRSAHGPKESPKQSGTVNLSEIYKSEFRFALRQLGQASDADFEKVFARLEKHLKASKKLEKILAGEEETPQAHTPKTPSKPLKETLKEGLQVVRRQWGNFSTWTNTKTAEHLRPWNASMRERNALRRADLALRRAAAISAPPKKTSRLGTVLDWTLKLCTNWVCAVLDWPWKMMGKIFK